MTAGTSTRGAIAVVGAALMVIVAGCGEDGDGDDSGETLQDFLGAPDAEDPQAMQAHFEDEQRRIEEHIVACMAAEGFDYEPRETSGPQGTVHPSQELERDEFVEEYGFGLTTIDPDEYMAEAAEDPNQEMLEAMDEAERQAYQEALHGEMPEPDPDAPDEPIEMEMGGCRGEAEDEVRGQQRMLQDELGDELQALFERAQSDPRVVEAQESWAACMRDAGWEFSEPGEPHQRISEQHNELLQDAGAMEVPDEIAELEPGEEPPEDFEPPAPPEPDPDALAELQEEELEVAAADHECQVDAFGEDHELTREVQEEYEREFVDEHRDALEELAD